MSSIHLRATENNLNRLTEASYKIEIKPNINRCTPIDSTYDSYSIIAGANSYWVLPIPTSLDYNSEYSWSSEDLEHGSGAPAAIVDSLKQFVTGNFGGFWDSVMGVGGSAAAGVINKGRSMLQESANTLGMNGSVAMKESERMFGRAYNPNKQLYFNGVEMRDFNLTFSLAPTSKEQAENIKNGFHQLAYASAPSFTNDSFYFTYPDFFKVAVIINEKGQNNHYKLIERAGLAITSLNLDFSSDGNITWHPDGFPTTLQLSVGFKESVVPTKENLQKITLFGKKIEG